MNSNSACPKKALITDVDNTLFDWFGVWHGSFSAMLEKTLEISGIRREVLLNEIQNSFRRHRTSEYAFVLEDCMSLKHLNTAIDLRPAIEAYRKARDQNLRLYEGVNYTLAYLQRRKVPVVAYTESIRYYTSDRLRRLEIADYFAFLYSPADHDLPAEAPPSADPTPKLPKRSTPPGEVKPNAHILLQIIEELGLQPQDCLYVGDSKSKDIAMANQAGVTSVWAKYGAEHVANDSRYDLLRQVTHWTKEDVLHEKEIAQGNRDVKPDHEIARYDEILPFF